MRKSFLFQVLVALFAVASIGAVDVPTDAPTEVPTVHPSVAPTVKPSVEPSIAPTVKPTRKPTVVPTAAPTVSEQPTVAPSAAPTVAPTVQPSVIPTIQPTNPPTVQPSAAPTVNPSIAPTVAPSVLPSIAPTVQPSIAPTVTPTVSPTTTAPSVAPSVQPSAAPSVHPTITPTVQPSIAPSVKPSVEPTVQPSAAPSVKPSVAPSVQPTIVPTQLPTVVPTIEPTVQPTIAPSATPTVAPTTAAPSVQPSVEPTLQPSVQPTVAPSVMPTLLPTVAPSVAPTALTQPPTTTSPTLTPSVAPSAVPSLAPSLAPSVMPSLAPSGAPFEATRMPTVSSRPTSISASPTVAGGWTSEKWYAGNKLILVSGRRTDYCIPFYVDKEIAFHYVNHCGSENFEEWIYAPDDVDCRGEIWQVNSYSMAEMHVEGVRFGQTQYTDITSYYYTCSAGKTDPLAQFSSTSGFAVRMNYPLSDDACMNPTTDIMSYVAYKRDYCFHLHGVNITMGDTVVPEVFATMQYIAWNNPLVLNVTRDDGSVLSFPFGIISTQYNEGTNCTNPGQLLGLNYNLVDICLHDDGVDFSDDNFDDHHENSHAVAAQKKRMMPKGVESKTSPVLEALKAQQQSKDFVHQMQNEKLLNTYKKMQKQGKYGLKRKLDGEDEGQGQQSESYYAEYELFVNWHEYGYKWTNAPAVSVPTVPTAAPTQAVGWFNEQWFAGSDMVIESSRRTGLCLPFYNNQTVAFNYVLHCGSDTAVVYIYADDDVECLGEIGGVAPLDFEYGATTGFEFGRQFYFDITNFQMTCTAGVTDPLTSQFTASYSVKANYPESDSDCESDYSGLLSYVAYKNDKCLNVNLGTNFEYMNGSTIYSVDTNSDVYHGVFWGFGCNTSAVVTDETYETDTCVDPTPLLISPPPAPAVHSTAAAAAMTPEAGALVKEYLNSDKVLEHMNEKLVAAYQASTFATRSTAAAKAKLAKKRVQAVSDAPSEAPTVVPTVVPTVAPTLAPTEVPTVAPTVTPSVVPTVVPTVAPSTSMAPSVAPTVVPTVTPSVAPTVTPTLIPTVVPTVAPSVAPSAAPTVMPTLAPSVVPTLTPTAVPTTSMAPSAAPSVVPTLAPIISTAPSVAPSVAPSAAPSEEFDDDATSYYSYYFDAEFQLFKGYTRNPSKWIVFPHATGAPVKVPTMAPTKSQVYTVSVSQGLTGISKTEFDSNTNNSLAFKASVVAVSPPGLTTNDVAIDGVNDASSRRTLRSLTVSAVTIDYTVTFNVFKLGFSDVDTAFAQLKGSLVNATSGDAFAAALFDAVQTYGGSSSLASATVTPASVSDPVQVSTGDDDASGGGDSKKSSDTALIIGLVVGLGGGLLLIAVAAYCFMSRRGNKVQAA